MASSGHSEGVKPGTAGAAAAAVDVFRDTPIRYLGYANELGESFRPLIPRAFVSASYVLAVGYVCADTIDKANKTALRFDRLNGAGQPSQPPAAQRAEFQRFEKRVSVGVSAADTLLWQLAASVIIPGAAVYGIVQTTRFICKRALSASKKVIRAVPTGVGLCSIPLIIHPIDSFVESGMNRFVRPPLFAARESAIDRKRIKLGIPPATAANKS